MVRRSWLPHARNSTQTIGRVHDRPLALRGALGVVASLALATTLLVPSAGAASSIDYTVQPGDSLRTIAGRYGTDTRAITLENHLARPDLIEVGQILVVPLVPSWAPSFAGTIVPGPFPEAVVSAPYPDVNQSEIAPSRFVPASRGARGASFAASTASTSTNTASTVADATVAPTTALSARPTFRRPASGPVSTPFGEPGPLWRLGYHPGLDIAAPTGAPIAACADGIVVEAGPDFVKGYGNYVKIDHGNGYISLYGHMSSVIASVGDRVTAGELIGRVGSTGVSTGPHLHWEIRLNGELRDPATFLP